MSGLSAGESCGDPTTAGGIHPVWRRDGQEPYYLNPEGAMLAAPITLIQNWTPEATK